MSIRAITLWRPWPFAIFDLPLEEAKDGENRDWAPPASLLGKPVAIHAGKKVDDADAFDFIADVCGWQAPTGGGPDGIIGLVRFDVAMRGAKSPWANPDKIFWHIARRVKLVRPVPCKGAQGLWTLPPDVEAAVRAALPPPRTDG